LAAAQSQQNDGFGSPSAYPLVGLKGPLLASVADKLSGRVRQEYNHQFLGFPEPEQPEPERIEFDKTLGIFLIISAFVILEGDDIFVV